MSQKNKGWPVMGTIRKGENGSYIKLADNVKILIDGEEVALNKSRTAQLQSPVAKVERLIANNVIQEADAESAREKAKEVNSWLKYDIVLAPPKQD